MDFLFDNPLANLSGPIYLVFYAASIILLSAVFAVLKRRLDYTARLPLPPVPPAPDPYEIAFLRGGENEIARSVVFSLTQKGLIKIINDGKASRIEPNKADFDLRHLNPMEQTAHSWFKAAREPKEIFERSGLTKVLEPFWQTYKSRLEQQQMLANEQLFNRLKPFKYLFVAAIAALGFYRFFASWMAGRTNIWGLVIVGVIGLLIFRAAARLPRLTKLGKAYVERLQLAFDNLKTQAQKNYTLSDAPKTAAQTAFAGVDPLLLSVGVFGSTVLAGTMYDDYNRAFQKTQAGDAGGGSSCGSGCGSADSSSGSDGGGSSCSSGCGGGCS